MFKSEKLLVFVRDVAEQHDKTNPTEPRRSNAQPRSYEGPLFFSIERENPGNEAVKCTARVHFPPKLSRPNVHLSRI